MSRTPGLANLGRVAIGILIVAAFAAGVVAERSSDRLLPSTAPETKAQLEEVSSAGRGIAAQLSSAAVRLPIAALLGAILALRPRPRGASRIPVVVQTQIVLAVVGALIMLVVGASLARAFGIVGVASLVRYRSRVKDPKDAVVMLSALGVGLACGVGLFFIALFATVFLVATLWMIESFEPEFRVFELTIKLGAATGDLRPAIDGILRRFGAEFELRTSAADEATYVVRVPLGLSTVKASEAIAALVPDENPSIDWAEKSKA